MGRLRRFFVLGCALSAPAGCAPPEPARLVALLGCGLEVPDGEEAAFTSLRVQARGDFPLDDDLEIRVSTSAERLAADPDTIAAVTVEGLLGDTVTAVGRTTRVQESGELPVYFAPEDQWCALTSAVPFRERPALAVGSDGDVLVVGGRDAQGRIIDDVVHLRDDDATIVTLPDALPVPSTGHTVHEIAPRRFAIVGGAGPNRTAIASVVHVDLERGAADVGEPVPLSAPAGIPVGRAYHGAATLADGRILVAGGCTGLENNSLCFTTPVDEEPPTPANVLASSFTLAFTVDDPVPLVEAGPPLQRARHDHRLLVARDGVAFAVGGRDEHGRPVLWPERLLVGADAFEEYGPEGLAVALDTPCPGAAPLGEDDPPPAPPRIDGAALLEGGLLLLAMQDGTIRFVSDTEVGCFPGWCVGDLPCFSEAPASDGAEDFAPGMRAPRSLLALPGERVLADGYLLPIAGVGSSGTDRIDLSRPTIDNPLPPPGQRTGAAVAVLADGSVLVAGGRDPNDAPALPFFVRLRPELDGPDERLPGIDDLVGGSLVSRQPDRVLLEEETVRLVSDADSASDQFPAVRMRARAFRSARFRFEVTLERETTQPPDPSEDAVPHIVLERGAVAATSIRLGPGVITRFLRDASGAVASASCGAFEVDFTEPVKFRIDVSPEAIRIRVAGREVGQCPGDGDVPAAIGVGVSGLGVVAASQMRLTRI